MAATPLNIILCSHEHEKLQMAAMIASVAAVSERPVRVFVSMNAVLAFRRGLAPEARYVGGELSQAMRARNAPDALELLGQGRMLGAMTMHVCVMALDVLGLTLEELEPDLFDGEMGLTAFLADAEDGELVTM